MAKNKNPSLAKCLAHYLRLVLNKLGFQIPHKTSNCPENLMPRDTCIFPMPTPFSGAKKMGDNDTTTNMQKLSAQTHKTSKNSLHDNCENYGNIDSLFPAIDYDQFDPKSSRFISVRPFGIAS